MNVREFASPHLSVVVIGGEQRARLERQIDGLLRQTAIDSIEVLIIDLRPELGPLTGAGHPAVRQIPSGSLETMWQGAAAGARAASGEAIAYLEDHCFAQPGWAEAVIETFQTRDVAMVNYAFIDTEPHTYLSSAFLMTEYGRWMAPAKAGPVSIASCNNIAYRREVLMRFAGELEKSFQVEYVMHRRIFADGGVAWLAPEAVAAHEDWPNLSGGLLANGSQKRYHAASVATNEKWSFAKRILYAGGMALTPALHLWRLTVSLAPRPQLWGRFLLALPVSITVYCYMALCEARGYLLGPGSSEADFVDVELKMTRKRP